MSQPNDRPTPELEDLRQKIDDLDKSIVDLLNQRAQVVVEVGERKRKSDAPIYVPHREAEVLRKVLSYNQGPLLPKTVEAIYRELMSGSFAIERPLRIGFLGPSGSHSHLAATRHFGSSVDFEDLHAIEGVFEEVARSHVDYGLVPIENSTGGSLTETMLAFLEYHKDVTVYGELQLAVHFSLLANCEPQQIQRIYATQESLGHCRNWVATQYPRAEVITMESASAAAIKASSDLNDTTESGSAAIGSEFAGKIYGLHSLFEQIEDRRNHITRFLIISRQETEISGDDKTSIMFTTPDKPGSLSDVLNVFKRAGVNLTHIDKCAGQGSSWEYTFFVDALAHRKDVSFAETIGEARAFANQMTVLGKLSTQQTGTVTERGREQMVRKQSSAGWRASKTCRSPSLLTKMPLGG